MASIADGSVRIQTTSRSVASTPSWFGEVVLMAAHLRKHDILTKIVERVRFARRRFGRYEVIDFLAVLFGYAISEEHTLEAFYTRLQPFAGPFMALFGRDRLPARSTLSRFLAALTAEPVEVLRALFLKDLLERRPDLEQQPCGLTDRTGKLWKVFDIDGTREAARQRALPKRGDLPAAQRRLDEVCAPGYTGRKRGEVVRTRTTVLQAHSYQWLGTFGHPGNGEYRKELRRAVEAIQSYLRAHQLEDPFALLRLDGLYGTGAVLADLLGLPFVMRCKLYDLLDLPIVQTRLHLPADQQFTLPESPLVRTLYDCPDVPVGAGGHQYRLVVATHPKGPKKQRIGIERDGLIYELFLTKLPQDAFTASDVVALYLHRGSFETTLSDEDREQDPDRWMEATLVDEGTIAIARALGTRLRERYPGVRLSDVQAQQALVQGHAILGGRRTPISTLVGEITHLRSQKLLTHLRHLLADEERFLMFTGGGAILLASSLLSLLGERRGPQSYLLVPAAYASTLNALGGYLLVQTAARRRLADHAPVAEEERRAG
jgi:hypothetical protein